jgi:energy-coupling factor transporter ATP-binding protein EcfA2
MHISEIRIRNFRSIDDLTIPLGSFAVFCGPNSCGKSNVFRAIQLAFQPQASLSEAQDNLPTSKLVAGGPMLSIWVDCKFDAVPPAVQTLAGITVPSTSYSFRLTRGGKLTRKLGTRVLTQNDFASFLQHFQPLYVPPIRDLSADGLVPFKHLIKTALQRARGAGNISSVNDAARTLLERRATVLLDGQADLVRRLLHADRLTLDTSSLNIEPIYDNIGLNIHSGATVKPLTSLGTGHQSAVIMHLYRQLGENMPGEVLYLFEEPDNHLHPSTIRSICEDLRGLSASSQVLVSTHSPIFLAHAGVAPLRPLVQTPSGETLSRKITLLSEFSEKHARALLDSYGLRLTEPLLSSRVIVCEGTTDKAILAALFEKRRGLSADDADILLISAGGKDKAVTLCHLLNCLGVDWWCVMDNDAAYSSEVAYMTPGLSTTDVTDCIAAIDGLKTSINVTTKRGRNAVNSLNAIRQELVTSPPPPVQCLDGSPLKVLLERTKLISTTEQGQLKTALTTGRKREASSLLTRAKTFIWSGTIEEVLLHDAASEACIETALVAAGQLQAPLAGAPNRTATLSNKLHEAGNIPNVLWQVVSALEDGNLFRRSEVNQCFKLAFPEPPA